MLLQKQLLLSLIRALETKSRNRNRDVDKAIFEIPLWVDYLTYLVVVAGNFLASIRLLDSRQFCNSKVTDSQSRAV